MKLLSGISIEDYTYTLPDSRIAKQPLGKRDTSKLLVSKNNSVYERPFGQIQMEIPENSLLVRNNTRVIQARLSFTKSTGANIEILCLEPHSPSSYEQNFAMTGQVEWMCLVGNAKKWKSGYLEKKVSIMGREIILRASLLQHITNKFLIRFSWSTEDVSFAHILDKAGTTPIPPYLNRRAEKRDKRWYQTTYAQLSGSVAAPTAGLHFTDKVFSSLKEKKIEIEEVTLHVGAGTFRPVQTEKISDHDMHTEAILVSRNTIEQLIKHHSTGITALGTTSLRTLESLYWLGRKSVSKPGIILEDQQIEQWEPYQGKPVISTIESLGRVREFMDSASLDEIRFSTKLIIVPGYKFHLAQRLVTNFHQPGSTLLLLVAAFIGDRWKSVYKYALENDFRFLSYGDSSILERRKT